MKPNSASRLIALAMASLAACSPASDADPTGEPIARSPAAATPPVERAAFEGRWTIAAFDGRPPLAGEAGARVPSLTFSRTDYGGTAGCNALGGIGTLNGARFYTQVGPQTVMACRPALAAQEAILDKVMRASPTIAMAPGGGMTLAGGGHRLTLTRDPSGGVPPVHPAPSLVGARFSIHSVDGVVLTPHGPRGDTRPLAFNASAWRATLVCATSSGTWRQDGWTLRGSAIATAPTDCADGTAINAAVRAVLASRSSFALGPNGELVLAGGGHWISGARDTLAAERDMPALAGSWQIVEIDGEPPRTFTGQVGQAVVQFGREAYGGSTGCNNIEGHYIAQRGRLYTNPGPTTQQGCGDLTAQEDRIYALLRGAPRIGRAGSEVRLVDDHGGLLLRRTGRPTGPSAGASPMPARYVGKYVAINGRPVEMRLSDPASLITISGGKLKIDIGCGAVSAVIRRRAAQTSLTSDPQSSAGRRCTGDRLGQHRLLMRLSNGPAAATLDENGDLLLAGDGVWLTARRN